MAEDANGSMPTAPARRSRLLGAAYLVVGVGGVLIGAGFLGTSIVQFLSQSLPAAVPFIFLGEPWALLAIASIAAEFIPSALLLFTVGAGFFLTGGALALHALDLLSGPVRRWRRKRTDAESPANDDDLAAFARLLQGDNV